MDNSFRKSEPALHPREESDQSSANALRQKAEEILKSRPPLATMPRSEAETRELLRELQLTQIELELQRKELQQVNEHLMEYDDDQKFRYMFARNPLPMWIYDLETLAFLEVNDAASHHYGYSREEFRSMTLKDIRPEEETDKLLRDVELTMRSYNPAGEWRHLKKHGEIIHVEIISHAITYGGHKARHVVVKDITARKQAEAALLLSEKRFRNALDQLLEGCMIIGFDWTYLYVNDSAARNGQNRPENLLGRTIFEMYPGVEKSNVFAHYQRCMVERIPQRFIEEYTFVDGTTVWNSFSVEPVREGIFILAMDITQQKSAEATLRVSEAKWRRLFDILPVGVSISKADREVLEFNSALGQILGIDKAGMRSGVFGNRNYFKPDNSLMNLEDFPSYKAIQENKAIRDFEFYAEKEDGSSLWLNLSAVPFPELEAAILVISDITQRKNSEEAIRKSNEQLTLFYQRLQEVKEIERAAIAREIHDELGQTLASLKLDLIGIREDDEDDAELTHKINDTISLVDASIKTVQKISASLRPQMLDELGLASAIEWLSNDFRKRSGIQCQLDLQEIHNLGKNISISLFRICQAALTNILLHSKAKSFSVKLALDKGMVVLSVKDDGIGISQEQICSSNSFGLIGIRERTKQMNGKFEIKTAANRGTEITVFIPLMDQNESL